MPGACHNPCSLFRQGIWGAQLPALPLFSMISTRFIDSSPENDPPQQVCLLHEAFPESISPPEVSFSQSTLPCTPPKALVPLCLVTCVHDLRTESVKQYKQKSWASVSERTGGKFQFNHLATMWPWRSDYIPSASAFFFFIIQRQAYYLAE